MIERTMITTCTGSEVNEAERRAVRLAFVAGSWPLCIAFTIAFSEVRQSMVHRGDHMLL